MDYPRINSYDIAAKYFAGARSQKAGRPLNTGTRLIKDEEGYVITRHKIPVCRIISDNHITFILPEDKMRRIAASLSASLHNILPFYIKRIGVGRYKLRHVAKAVIRDYHKSVLVDGYLWGKYHADTKQAGDEMFYGIVFNLSTGECTNPMPPKEKRKVDKDKRKVWLQRKKTFEQHMSLFERMGVIDGALKASMPEVAPFIYQAFNGNFAKEALKASIMSDGVPSKELIAYVAGYVRSQYYSGRLQSHPQAGVQMVVRDINRMLRANSFSLREAMGVFI